MEDGAQEKLYEYINSNSLQSLITQICARSKSLLILWNFLKIGVAIFFEDATHRLSNILPMAFRTYRSWPLAHTPARNICGRSKLWCWRHRCTVRGSTSGAVYTSFINLFWFVEGGGRFWDKLGTPVISTPPGVFDKKKVLHGTVGGRKIEVELDVKLRSNWT